MAVHWELQLVVVEKVMRNRTANLMVQSLVRPQNIFLCQKSKKGNNYLQGGRARKVALLGGYQLCKELTHWPALLPSRTALPVISRAPLLQSPATSTSQDGDEALVHKPWRRKTHPEQSIVYQRQKRTLKLLRRNKQILRHWENSITNSSYGQNINSSEHSSLKELFSVNKNIPDTEAWCCVFAVYMFHKVLVYLAANRILD